MDLWGSCINPETRRQKATFTQTAPVSSEQETLCSVSFGHSRRSTLGLVVYGFAQCNFHYLSVKVLQNLVLQIVLLSQPIFKGFCLVSDSEACLLRLRLGGMGIFKSGPVETQPTM